MAQVSRREVHKEVWERIFDLYLSTLSSLNKRELEAFLEDFYTPTEKIMLAKRFACIILLAKEKDYRTIMETLKVTPATVARMSLRLKYADHGLNAVINKALSRQAVQIMVEELKDLVDLPRKQIYSSERLKRHYERERKISRIKSSV